MLDANEIRYMLAKQLPSAYSLETNYGSIALDAELSAAIEAALRPILEGRIKLAEHIAGVNHG